MKADLTRDTFAPERHYAWVIQQQGRVPLDADWNEQALIQAHHDEVETIDVIGPAGFPVGPSFQLSASPDKTDLLVGDGTGYVAGILAENANRAVDVIAFSGASTLQLSTLILDGTALRAGEWLVISDPNNSAYTPAVVRVQTVDPATQTVTLTGSVASSATAVARRAVSYLIQPDFYDAPELADGVYVAYLDVWRRHVTALEDPHIREVALGGPDTATRAKTMWQVRLATIAEGQPADCTTALPAQTSTGRLRARAKQPASGDSPCVITPTARYRSLENQLYRVEVHDPGGLGTATFKFSRDNGMVLTSWTASSSYDLTVSSLGKDKVLGFAAGQWIELLDDTLEQDGVPGTLAKIASVDPATTTITIDPASVYPPISPATRGLDITKYPLNPRIRRWDHVSTTAAMQVQQPAGDGYLDLEQGVQIRFETGNYATGDYWLIPARTITADVEWPRNEAGDPLPQPRAGIVHAFARLGIVTISGGLVTGVSDCRAQFPPLTQLPPSGGGQGCCCGIAIGTKDDPQTAINSAIASAGTAKIAGLTIEFAAGTFTLGKALDITAPQGQGGHLVVKGCGSATQLVGPKLESVLRISGWDSVVISDLYAESGVLGESGDFDHLQGAITIRNCGSKRAERLELRCAAGTRRQGTCLTMWDDAPGANQLGGDATVEGCRMHVGHMQVGVLIVNQRRTSVTDNFVETFIPIRETIINITTSPEYLSAYRRLVLKDVMLSLPGQDHSTIDGFSNRQFAVGQTRVLFRTDSALGDAWDHALKTAAPKAFHFLAAPRPQPAKPATTDSATPVARRERVVKTPAPANEIIARPPINVTAVTPKGMGRVQQKQALKVRTRLNKMAYAILSAAAHNTKTTLTPAQLKPFKDWLAAMQQSFAAVASAGIVVAGQTGGDIRVVDNTVYGALDGIHLGFSHRVPVNAPADIAERVQVIGNSVAVLVRPEITRGVHRGIFVGNATSVIVQRNRVTVTLATRQPPVVDGISLIGLYGHCAIVSENDVSGAPVGIRFWPTAISEAAKQQWLAVNNATFNCTQHIVATGSVIQTGNLP